jgi:uncharacterized membrane protein YfcA
MFYSWTELLTIALIMTLGSVIQGAVGFASGLLAVPLLVTSGFSIPEAATINLTSTSVQNVIGSWRLWSELEPRALMRPILLRWAGIPLGAYALIMAHDLQPAQVKQLIGAVLLLVVVALSTIRPKPRPKLPIGWEVLAMTSSGFMLGFASIGGASLALYVNALTWTTNRSRAFLFFCSASGVPLAGFLLWWNFGNLVLTPAIATLFIMPLVLSGLWLGMHWGNQLDKWLFRRLTFGLLLALAVASIVGPLLRGS